MARCRSCCTAFLNSGTRGGITSTCVPIWDFTWWYRTTGYNLSDKPAGRWNYLTKHVVADAVALIDALHAERLMSVGHDWGGHVAWATAEQYPDRIARMVILNVAHPKVMVRTVFTNPRQI